MRRLQHHLNLPAADYNSTPYGIRTQFPIVPFSAYFPARQITDLQWSDRTRFIPLSQWYLAILECGHKNYPGHLLARVCYTQHSSYAVDFSFCGYVKIGLPRTPDPANRKYDLLPLSPTALKRLRTPQIKFEPVYIPHAQDRDGASNVMRRTPHDSIKLVLLKKTREELQARGYTVEFRGPDSARPTTHWLALTHPTHDIAVEFQHALEGRLNNQKLTVRSGWRVSGKGTGSASQTDSMPWQTRLLGTSGTTVSVSGTEEWVVFESLRLAAKDHYTVDFRFEPGFSKSLSRTLMPAGWSGLWRACREWLRRVAGRISRATAVTFVARGHRERRDDRPGGLYSEMDEDA